VVTGVLQHRCQVIEPYRRNRRLHPIRVDQQQMHAVVYWKDRTASDIGRVCKLRPPIRAILRMLHVHTLSSRMSSNTAAFLRRGAGVLEGEPWRHTGYTASHLQARVKVSS